MTALVLPVLLIGILFVKSESLQDETFEERFGQLYSNMDCEKKANDLWARAYFLIFVVRRWCFIIVCFTITSSPIIQILIVVYLQLSILIYQGYFRPGPDRFSNRMDIFNELQVMVCTQTIILFTEWLSPDLQFEMGWYWIGILLMTALINLVVIFYLSFHSLYLLIKKYYRRVKKKMDPYFKRLQDLKASVLNNGSLESDNSEDSQSVSSQSKNTEEDVRQSSSSPKNQQVSEPRGRQSQQNREEEK